eukprot:7992369-Alexandrium_andersonii.AAC.1
MQLHIAGHVGEAGRGADEQNPNSTCAVISFRTQAAEARPNAEIPPNGINRAQAEVESFMMKRPSRRKAQKAPARGERSFRAERKRRG